MYSIIEICEKGCKVRYASNDLEEIYKKYTILNSIYIKYNKNKLHIFDDINNKTISLEYLEILITQNNFI